MLPWIVVPRTSSDGFLYVFQNPNSRDFAFFCLVSIMLFKVLYFCTAEPFSMQVGRLDLGYWEVLAYSGSSIDTDYR